jgi:hypothetical protein
MYTSELNKLGKQHIPGFIGAFPLDKLPLHICTPPSSYIVNTDTHNLSGHHWIAISYEKSGIVRAFDPLGIFYPQLLTEKLHKFPHKKIIYNRLMHQNPLLKTCGLHCLNYLKYRSQQL